MQPMGFNHLPHFLSKQNKVCHYSNDYYLVKLQIDFVNSYFHLTNRRHATRSES